MQINNIEQYYPLIKKIALKYKNLPVPQEDLVQEGYIGLIKAAEKYDSDKGTKFSTYAVWWIKKKILEALEREDIREEKKLEINDSPQSKIQIESEEIDFPENFPESEMKILKLLYEKQMTLKEISEQLGIKREKVRRLKELGKRRLKNYHKKKKKEKNYSTVLPDNLL